MKLVTLLVFIATTTAATLADYVIDITDYQQDCENGLPMFGMDMSDLETEQDDEGNPSLSGRVVFTEEYNEPISIHSYTKRLLHGSWQDGEISRDVDNLCALLTIPFEPWFPFFSAMTNQACPFAKGHIESLENVKLGDIPISFPESFAGEWRMYMEISTPRGDETVTECMRVAFDIKEV